MSWKIKSVQKKCYIYIYNGYIYISTGKCLKNLENALEFEDVVDIL